MTKIVPNLTVWLQLCSLFTIARCLNDNAQQRKQNHLRASRNNKAACEAETDPRPQLHFTPTENWMNDPNGLVYYKGDYHLFYQYTPESKHPGHKSWGHAVSNDLMHWRELEMALSPDEAGDMWSGSAVVDWYNSSGLQLDGEDPPMLAFYTNMPPGGGLTGVPSDQRLAVSRDRGRTWQKKGAVVPPFLDDGDIRTTRRQARDPKVQWHSPSAHWIMVLYAHAGQVLLYRSKDLQSWEELQDIGFKGAFECPDFFELPVAGDSDGARYWVLMMGDGRYQIGTFDGETFLNISDVQDSEWGSGYASSTFNEEPNGRRVQISWIAPPYGRKHPLFANVSFSGSMTVPRVLDLVQLSSNLKVRRQPVTELVSLRRQPALFAGSGTLGRRTTPLQSLASSGTGGLEVVIQAQVPKKSSVVLSLLSEGASEKYVEIRLQGKAHGRNWPVAQVFWNDLHNIATPELYTQHVDFKFSATDSSRNSTELPLYPAMSNHDAVEIRVLFDWGTLEVFDVKGGASMAAYVTDLGMLFSQCHPLFVQVASDETLPNVVLDSLEVYELESTLHPGQ